MCPIAERARDENMTFSTGHKCQVDGCTRGGACTFAYRGWFCDQHHEMLQHIRHKLVQAKLRNSLEDQIHWRIQEMLCRKHTDAGHWQILCLLIGRVDPEMYPMYMDILFRLKMFLASCSTPVVDVQTRHPPPCGAPRVAKGLQRRWMGEDRYILAC